MQPILSELVVNLLKVFDNQEAKDNDYVMKGTFENIEVAVFDFFLFVFFFFYCYVHGFFLI